MKGFSKGMSLAEVVIGAAIMSAFLVAIVGVYNIHLKVIFASSKNVKAVFLAEETLESVRYLRDLSWGTNISSLSNNTDYFLVWQNGKWVPTLSNILVDGLYERKFRLEAVGRDAQGNIISSGGTNDPNTRKITVSLSWLERSATTTRSMSTYITNLFDN